MDKTLQYLRESLSNYIDSDICGGIYQKLEYKNYNGEGEFVEELNDDEMKYLNSMLVREINYARNVQNDNRVKELNEVYELLF
ncbi:sporulation protein [Virgibacillus oceani]|uniref:sporulation protein n=1 Tax=Virgibacillus oceani TaxID=1479511 RepID=UPI001664597A|nr:sporulation protein [Virgibacillus oceani]